MSYTNPLHHSIAADRISSFSTLVSDFPHYVPPKDNRIHVPIRRWNPPSKWKGAMGPKFSPGRTISFNHAGAPEGYGVSVSNLTAYSNNILMQMVHRGHETVFADTREKKIMLRIVWPGYENLDSIHAIDVMPYGQPITRSQLAAVVASHYSSFIGKAERMPSSVADWRVSSALFDKLIIVSIVNVYEDTWQADVVIDTRR